jgi:hypothetical protein
MIKRFAVLALLPLVISGCAATGGISALGLANGAVTGALAGIAPTLSVEQILENAALYHNLRVQLDMIEGMGIVTTTTQTPVVVTGTPMTPVTPVTPVTPITPPPVVTPPSTGSDGPIVTPSARYRHRVQGIGRIPPDTIHAVAGSESPISTLSATLSPHEPSIEGQSAMAVFDWDKWGRPIRADKDVLLH